MGWFPCRCGHSIKVGSTDDAPHEFCFLPATFLSRWERGSGTDHDDDLHRWLRSACRCDRCGRVYILDYGGEVRCVLKVEETPEDRGDNWWLEPRPPL